MKYAKFILIILLIGNTFWSETSAQSRQKIKTQKKIEETTKLLTSKQFVFKVSTAQPMRGGNFNITSDYDLVIKRDTIQSYLPYFGRAFSAPINPTNSPLNFTTTKFNFTSTKDKKGSTIIKIELNDPKVDVRQYLLTISEQGYGLLQTLSNNRDPISFNGYITSIL